MMDITTWERITALLLKQLKNEASAEELNELERWEDEHPALAETLQSSLQKQQLQNGLKELAEVKQYLDQQLTKAHVPVQPVNAPAIHHLPFFRKWKWVAAAILMLAIGSGIYYFNNQSYKSQKSPQITVQTKGTGSDIPPGTYKAIWTLTDGKRIELDSTVLDMNKNRMQFNNTGYNELRTPRGGQYQLILPDGSKVWLNAASSIKYPVVFNGTERSVHITGEVYFEITKDASKPFKVYSDEQQIEVLGTAFNVNTYDDEPFKASLIEGAIKINQQILKPGQAYINGEIITTDPEQDIAWKSGMFQFKGATIQEVMRQIARWYDVEIIYNGNVPSKRFQGEFPRDIGLQSVLKILEVSKIQAILEDRTIIITN